MLFVNENKFNLLGSDVIPYVWRRSTEKLFAKNIHFIKNNEVPFIKHSYTIEYNIPSVRITTIRILTHTRVMGLTV